MFYFSANSTDNVCLSLFCRQVPVSMCMFATNSGCNRLYVKKKQQQQKTNFSRSAFPMNPAGHCCHDSKFTSISFSAFSLNEVSKLIRKGNVAHLTYDLYANEPPLGE